MTRRGLLGTAALAAAMGGACNFETSFRFDAHVDPGAAPGDSFRDACQDQAVAFCSYHARCFSLSFELNWPDAATCEERVTLACQLEATDPSSTYDDASIRSCARPLDMPCPSDPGYDSAFAAFRAACQPPPGELPDGAACAWASACASGYCGPDSSPATVCGACAPPPCGGGCAPGQSCLILGLTSKCLGAVGDPCTVPEDCSTLRCEGAVCAALLGVGDACDPSENACESSYCDSVTEECTPFAIAQENEPCGASPSGYAICGGSGYCPSSISPTCAPPAEDGALCDPTQGRWCLFPARCDNGFCRFPPACTPPT